MAIKYRLKDEYLHRSDFVKSIFNGIEGRERIIKTLDFYKIHHWFKWLNEDESPIIGHWMEEACPISEKAAEKLVSKDNSLKLEDPELSWVDPTLYASKTTKTKNMNQTITYWIAKEIDYSNMAKVILQRSSLDYDQRAGKIILNPTKHTASLNRLEALGVIDLWFEPVYSDPKPPKINDYEGEDLGKSLKYGCSEFKKKHIRTLFELGATYLEMEIDGESVGVDKEDFNALKEYLQWDKNRKS